MDAFAVAMCKGLSMNKIDLKKASYIGIFFGLFQGIMPIIGYFLGIKFQSKIVKIDHWIAFVLLFVIGINMIKEIWEKEDYKNNEKENLSFKNMIILSVATSIDALAVGITFAFLKCNIFISALTIGIITFVISLIGVKMGNMFGAKYENKSKLIGGSILIILGFKILLEHLNII